MIKIIELEQQLDKLTEIVEHVKNSESHHLTQRQLKRIRDVAHEIFSKSGTAPSREEGFNKEKIPDKNAESTRHEQVSTLANCPWCNEVIVLSRYP